MQVSKCLIGRFGINRNGLFPITFNALFPSLVSYYQRLFTLTVAFAFQYVFQITLIYSFEAVIR